MYLLICILNYIKNLYSNNRIDKIEKVFWEAGNPIPQHIVKNLEDKEMKLYEDYTKIINKYTKNLTTVDLDLTKVIIKQ